MHALCNCAFPRVWRQLRNWWPMKQFSFGKEERLRRHHEFKRAMRKGESRDTDHFTVFILPNQINTRRLGITASRKVGAATRRNRIKRLLREFFRLHKPCLPPSSDILFVVKPGADQVNYPGLCEELKILLKPDKSFWLDCVKVNLNVKNIGYPRHQNI